MMKLRSLFRRGPNSSSSSAEKQQSASGGGHHQSHPSRHCNTQGRNRHKSQSTQSLNASNEVEAKVVTSRTAERGRAVSKGATSSSGGGAGAGGGYYPPHLPANGQEVISERGVDVGEAVGGLTGGGSQGQHNRHQSVALVGASDQHLTCVELGSQTLPHKKSKETATIVAGIGGVLKKEVFIKQSKVAPPRKNNNNNNNNKTNSSSKAPLILNSTVILPNKSELYGFAQKDGEGDLCTLNPAAGDAPAISMAAVASGTPSGQNVVVKGTPEDKVQDELYALNPAFVAAAAAAGYQFISKEQQQMWEVNDVVLIVIAIAIVTC